MNPAPGPEQVLESILAREQGLARQLSTRHLGMIAIGGAIGTGLFLGSSLAVRVAGPGVILSYLIGALIALLLAGVLSEMAVAHPTAGSFGVYAEMYVNRWAGFTIRYTYWAAQAIAIGGEAVAAAIYCQWWFPETSVWFWVVGFSVGLVYINARSVGSFGEFEYWLAMIKVVAIVMFIVFGVLALAGWMGLPAIGSENYTAHGGFLPHGLSGVWMALVFVIFGYIGTEVVAVTSGEAKDPEKAIPRAMRSMIGRLIVFYVLAITILIGVVPWNQIQPGEGVTASPFVKLFALIGIPSAAHIVNFVVLTAALSSMNTNLYLATRMIFSLSRGGYAPSVLGRVTKKGTPVFALLVTSAGLLVATTVAIFAPRSAYVHLFGIALFGGLYVWAMIFITHLFFRTKRRGERQLPVRMPGWPYTPLLGAALVIAILITTYWVEGMKLTLIVGLPWLGLISLCYWLWVRRHRPGRPDPVSLKSGKESANALLDSDQVRMPKFSLASRPNALT